jgi:hypothetical protein
MAPIGRDRRTIAGVNRLVAGWKDDLSQIASSRRLTKEALQLSLNSSCRLALTTLVFTAALAACGGTTAGSPSPVVSPSVALPTTTAAPSSCPTAAVVGSALGITLPKPVGVAGGGGTQLPAGATGEVCDYHAQSFNVIISVLRNISPSYITQFSSRFPVAYKSVSGVGDQARSFTAPIGGGKDNEGVVATKGSTLVAITATATPVSLTQVETLVSQLL